MFIVTPTQLQKVPKNIYKNETRIYTCNTHKIASQAKGGKIHTRERLLALVLEHTRLKKKWQTGSHK